MIIYNLFPLLAGPFTHWGAHLERASDLGCTWVFVNPIQMPGLSGSLYSIKDYGAFNPLLLDSASGLTGDEQMELVVAGATDLGLGLMVDLVVNHCAVDSALLKEHPGWFRWGRGGKVEHPFAMEGTKKVVWGDLARIDHEGTKDPEGLYAWCRGVVERMIGQGFRAFRCDAAYQVPAKLWERLIREVKAKHPRVLFLAETLGCTPAESLETARAGFDYVFNSAKWWDFSSPWLMEQYNLTREVCGSVAFPESHDTERLCHEAAGKATVMKQRYIFTALFSSGVMFPLGFEYGFRKRPHVVESRPGDWEEGTGVDLCSFITKVNRIKAENPVFQVDAPTWISDAANPAIMLMRKVDQVSGQRAVVALNRDVDLPQQLVIEDVGALMGTKDTVRDVSPRPYFGASIRGRIDCPLEPGQGLVLVTEPEECG